MTKNCLDMEIKKNKHANLEPKKKSIFLFGLMTSLGFLFMAFEYSSKTLEYELPEEKIGELIETLPEIINLEIERPKPLVSIPPVEQPPIVDTFVVDPTTPDPNTLVDNPISPEKPTLEIDSSIKFMEHTAPVIEPITTFAEVMPQYPGGLKNLYSDLSKNLYENPMGIKGKIYVEFVVEKNGTISDVRLKNNLHPELDNQALNAIKKLKNWSPGVQNHHPVRVRMVLPINFIVR